MGRCVLGVAFLTPQVLRRGYAHAGGTLLNPATISLVFSMFDLDGDGRIDAEELHAALAKLGRGVDLDVARAFLARVDRDRVGSLTSAQFAELLALPPPPADLLRAFRAFDLDGDGYVGLEELGAMFASVGIDEPAAFQELLAELDANGDGRVDLGEWLSHAGATA